MKKSIILGLIIFLFSCYTVEIIAQEEQNTEIPQTYLENQEEKNVFIRRYVDRETRSGKLRIYQLNDSNEYPFPFRSFDEFSYYCGENIDRIIEIDIQVFEDLDLNGIDKFISLNGLRIWGDGISTRISGYEDLYNCTRLDSIEIAKFIDFEYPLYQEIESLTMVSLYELKNLDPLLSLSESVYFLRFSYEVDYLSKEEVENFVETHREKIAPQYLDVYYYPVRDGVALSTVEHP